MKETNPQWEISNLTWLESRPRKKKSWSRRQRRLATNPQPPGVRAVRRPRPRRQSLSRPPLLLPNRLLTWHTSIGKLAAIRVVLPRKIGCAPNRNCALKPPLPDLLLRSQKLEVKKSE